MEHLKEQKWEHQMAPEMEHSSVHMTEPTMGSQLVSMWALRMERSMVQMSACW